MVVQVTMGCAKVHTVFPDLRSIAEVLKLALDKIESFFY